MGLLNVLVTYLYHFRKYENKPQNPYTPTLFGFCLLKVFVETHDASTLLFEQRHFCFQKLGYGGVRMNLESIVT